MTDIESEEEKDCVTLTEIANRLGIEKSNARKYILNLNCTNPFRIRTLESGNQLCLAWSKEDAEKIYEHRKNSGFTECKKILESSDGYFYVIKIFPEFSENRIKLGFSSDMTNRIIQHKCISPTLQLIKTWKCKRYWEPVIIDIVEKEATKKYSNEVYDFDCLEILLEKVEKFFSFTEI